MPNQTGHNAAMSDNLREAVKEEDGRFSIDFEKFAFAQGEPNPAIDITVEQSEESITIRWDKNRAVSNKFEFLRYRITVLFFPDDPIEGTADGIQYGSYLSDRIQTLLIKGIDRRMDQHIYIAFHNTDGSNTSTDSIYI